MTLRRPARLLAVAALGLTLSGQTMARDESAGRDVWYEIVGPKGELIGFQHEWEAPGPAGIERGRRRELAFRIDGHAPTRSSATLVRRHDRSGALLALIAEQVTPRSRLRTVAHRDGRMLEIESDFNGHKRKRRIAMPQGMAGDSLSLGQLPDSYFELSAGSATIAAMAVAMAQVPGQPGTRLRQQRLGARLVGVDVLDSEGAFPARATMPLLGYDLSLRQVAGPIPVAQVSDQREIPHEMARSQFFIGPHALRGQIRYKFGWRFGFSAPLPQTGEQRVTASNGAMQLDICTDCGAPPAPDAAQLAAARQPSAWIESDAPEFRAAVRRAGRGSETARMQALAAIARARLSEIDFEGHVSARAAWQRRAGDCTEDAVVLAALARAAGFPARVANGLVYSRQRYHGAANAFLPHSWVVAWVDGRWRSFDISLEGFDASHIALTIGDGEPAAIVEANKLAALLDWQAMGEVRKP